MAKDRRGDPKAHSKRLQLKFRRRREGKTNYHKRRRLIVQDLDKYQAPKYRFVVRISNRYVTCQIIYATARGDVVVEHATSDELRSYNLTVGLCNYPAAYATGLLCARRLLQKLSLDSEFEVPEEVTGEHFLVEGERRPFKCFLDVGLHRATRGAKVFAAMKGACDGGLYIPHSPARFAGFSVEEKELNAEELRGVILGSRIANYMRSLSDEELKKRFGDYVEAGVGADDLEELYLRVHADIRKEPQLNREKKVYEKSKRGVRLNAEERRERARERAEGMRMELVQ